MNIDERLLAYKPISITLNFDWDKMSYDERVLARHNYIEEQKKTNPNYAGWDFPEHFSSVHANKNKPLIYSIDFNKLVSTIGQMVNVIYGKVYVTLGNKNKRGYLEINMDKNGKKSKLRIHRLVSCTFIPIPKNLEENRKSLIINHKNDIKTCNLRSNLEWCTHKENVIKAYETGAALALSFKLTVIRPGPLLNKEFYFFNRTSLNSHGFSNTGIYNYINNGKSYLWGRWEIIPRGELIGKKLGMDPSILKDFKDPKYGQVNSVPWVGTILSEGPCKGEKFVIYGSTLLVKYGFNSGSVMRVIKGEKLHYIGCGWERMTREEAVDIPIGLTEAQKEHIFGKDTNK